MPERKLNRSIIKQWNFNDLTFVTVINCNHFSNSESASSESTLKNSNHVKSLNIKTLQNTIMETFTTR